MSNDYHPDDHIPTRGAICAAWVIAALVFGVMFFAFV